MEANIVSHFAAVAVGDIDLTTKVSVESGTEVQAVVAEMAAAGQSGAVVTAGDEIVGIFTERDVTTKVARSPDRWEIPIDEFMTPDPLVIGPDASAIDALRLLNANTIRNVPVVAPDGAFLGTLTFYDLIRLASRHLKSHTGTDDELSAEHSLLYIDLTGIEAGPALQIPTDGTVASAIEMMIEGRTGLVSVVNDRGVVVGEFTEHDVFTKLACRVTDLEDEIVGEWMTEVIAGALPSTSIADGLHLMAEVGHRYLVILNETHHALGVLTFRDFADYFETALAVG